MPLPKPPTPEPPRIATLDGLAPKFRDALLRILGVLEHERVFESLRTNERQRYLYGFGRQYDDGRGAVTRASVADHGWHFFGLAVDIVQSDADPWVAPMNWWNALGAAARLHGCTWGGDWTVKDLPHVQWGGCSKSPNAAIRAIYASGGLEAVWRDVGAL